MFFSDLLSNALGQLIGELFGETIEQKLDRRALLREIGESVERAEQRFVSDYRQQDAELADALGTQTRFADLPSVRAALRELLTRPFHDPQQSVAVLRQSFADVLPERVDRARVDAAMQAFLEYLGQEVLYIPQLRELYTLAFHKSSVEHSRATADHAAALVRSIEGLRGEMRQIAVAPPLMALPAATSQPARRAFPWHNLPQRSFTRFVGRQAELEKLTQLLLPHPRSRHFVVTLDGIGGVGKSALALELAYRFRDSHAALPETERFDAIVWISAKRTLLTASGIQQRQQTFNTLNDLYREIATVLEQPDILQADTNQRRGLLERALTAQRTLLIVDNLETVDDEELLSFLRELPDPTKAIVTTRHRIDIAYSIRLTGMPEPDAQALMVVEAARKGVELSAEAGSDLYRRTGGIPLAIVWSIGLMSLGHSIESVLRRLGSGQSDIARFCFAESMARIRGRDPERLLFALALFERSVSRQMIGDVAGLGGDVIGRDDGLAELLQLSLIDQNGDRFKLLPLTHSFALERLIEQPEVANELRERWIETLASLARPYLYPDWRLRGLSRLQLDGNHLVTMANWAQQTQRVADFLAIVPAVMAYYDRIGDWGDLIRIGKLALIDAQLTDDPLDLLRIENILAWILSQQGKHQEAELFATQAMNRAEEIGSASWKIDLIQTFSQVLRRQLQFDRAVALCARGMQLTSEITEEQQPYVRANLAYELGKIARDREAWLDAEQYFLAAQTVYNEDVQDPIFNLEWAWGLLSNLGLVAHKRGHLDIAAERYQKALSFFQNGGSTSNIATLLVRMADLACDRGDLESARRYIVEAQERSLQLGLAHEQVQAEAILRRLSAAE